MTLPTKDVLGILIDNLLKRRSVLQLSERQATGWAKGLNIAKGGETVLYTGHMYQLVPFITALSSKMAAFENSWITRFFGLGRFVNKFINLSWFMAQTDARERRRYSEILRSIARLLQAANVQFGYLYGEEIYSGALAHDEGAVDAFKSHAERVFEMLRRNGVRRVITVDPHTTNMLRSVYPNYLEGYDLEVRSYLEVLAESDLTAIKPLDLELVIHDSCVYARYEDIVNAPRRLLEHAGAYSKEPELSGKLTHCCGGPIESLFPSKAHVVANQRMDQLAPISDNIVTMCPICLVNLKHAAEGRNVRVKDISEYLVQAYCDGV